VGCERREGKNGETGNTRRKKGSCKGQRDEDSKVSKKDANKVITCFSVRHGGSTKWKKKEVER